MQRVLSEPAKARVAPDTARVALILASGTRETGTPSEVPSHPLSEPSNPRPDQTQNIVQRLNAFPVYMWTHTRLRPRA
jgi:hypothetical protein